MRCENCRFWAKFNLDGRPGGICRKMSRTFASKREDPEARLVELPTSKRTDRSSKVRPYMTWRGMAKLGYLRSVSFTTADFGCVMFEVKKARFKTASSAKSRFERIA